MIKPERGNKKKKYITTLFSPPLHPFRQTGESFLTDSTTHTTLLNLKRNCDTHSGEFGTKVPEYKRHGDDVQVPAFCPGGRSGEDV